MSDFPFKIGDSVGVYFSEIGVSNPPPEELTSLAIVGEILKERIVTLQNGARYAEINGEYREFSNEGYRRNTIRPLDADEVIAAKAVLAEQKRLREMKYEIDRLVHQYCKSDLQAFWEHIKVFRGI